MRLASRCGALFASLAVTMPAVAHAAKPGETAPEPRWELTVGVSGRHRPGEWIFKLPATEMNYRWSDRIELTSTLSLSVLQPDNSPQARGDTSGGAGVKWLLLNDEAAGFSLKLWPELTRTILPAPVGRGLDMIENEFSLALETKMMAAGVAVELKTGPRFIPAKPAAWGAELKLARRCLGRAECNVTIERSFVPKEELPVLVKLGLDWQLDRAMTLKTALGNEFGVHSVAPADMTIDVALKIVY